jgi:hypothetical protein
MIGAIVYGVASGGFTDEFRAVLELPWGQVTLVDLAAGLLLIGAWIAWREGSMVRALPWWAAMVLTGNLASAVYVIRAAQRSPSMQEFLMGSRSA